MRSIYAHAGEDVTCEAAGHVVGRFVVDIPVGVRPTPPQFVYGTGASPRRSEDFRKCPCGSRWFYSFVNGRMQVHFEDGWRRVQ